LFVSIKHNLFYILLSECWFAASTEFLVIVAETGQCSFLDICAEKFYGELKQFPVAKS